MRGVITAPANIIGGAFNILISFPSEVELSYADIFIETLAGNALGNKKDTFGGSGNHYFMLCYLADGLKGKCRIHVLGHEVAPVEIEYDTVRTITVAYGDPIRRGRKTEIPFTLSDPVVNLRKIHFSLSRPAQKELYGAGTEYQIVVHGSTGFRVTATGTVKKENGLTATITEAVLDVQEV